MINRIKIKNFRSVKSFDEPGINNVLAFIGENSGGKSTILDAILVFFGKKKLSSLDFHYDETLLEIGLALDIDDNSIEKLINLCEKNNDDFYKKFKEEYNRKPNRGINTKKYRDELKSYFKSEVLKSRNTRYIYLLLKCKRGLLESHEGKKSVRYYISNNEFKPIKEINPEDSIFNAFKPMIAYIGDERNFENEKFGKKDTTTNSILNVLLKSMRSKSNIYNKDSLKDKSVEELSILELNEILLNKIREQSDEMLKKTNKLFQENYNNEDIKVNWDFDNNLYESINILSTFNLYGKQEIDFLSIGSGTRNIYLLSLLQSYVEITAYNNENVNILFMIEEPEIYLYPKLQDDMGNILFEISKKHQIFITTHSGSIVQKFKLEDIYHVKRTSYKKNNYSRIKKLNDFDKIIETLGFNSYPLMKKNFVIFVEGKDDKKQYKKLIERFYNNKEKETLFVNINGVDNIEVALNLQIISYSDLRNRCLIIRDSDGISDEERLRKTTMELMKTVGSYYSENEIRNMIYCTEESILECLTMYPKYCNQQWDEEKFYIEYKRFLNEYKEDIYKVLEDKGNYNLAEKIYDGVYRESSLDYFREYAVNKRIYKKVKRYTRGFRGIGNIKNQEECRKLVPKLFDKLDNLFKEK